MVPTLARSRGDQRLGPELAQHRDLLRVMSIALAC